MDLDIKTEQHDDRCSLTLDGEVDVATSPSLKSALVSVAEQGCSRIVVDMRNVTFIDSSGLGVLVGALRRARENGGSVHVVCTRESTLKVFRITGLDKVFGIYASAAEAAAF